VIILLLTTREKRNKMNPVKILIVCTVLLLLLCAPSWARRVQLTNAGFVACHSIEDLESVLGFADRIDEELLGTRITTGDCIILEPNVPVFVEETSWSRAKIRFQGTEIVMWTVIGALRFPARGFEG
jgi:hypothetical protein